MGNVFGVIYPWEKTPDVLREAPTPPNYGFEERGLERKERVMIATDAEMISARMEPKYRNYCAHKFINFQICKTNQLPWVVKCAHEKHEYEHCMFEDQEISRKEYEREQRLINRAERKQRLEKLREERAAA